MLRTDFADVRIGADQGDGGQAQEQAGLDDAGTFGRGLHLAGALDAVGEVAVVDEVAVVGDEDHARAGHAELGLCAEAAEEVFLGFVAELCDLDGQGGLGAQCGDRLAFVGDDDEFFRVLGDDFSRRSAPPRPLMRSRLGATSSARRR